jgi:hypothetical protein
LTLIGVLFISCTTRPVTPTRASRRAVDTIYQQRILALQPHIDSSCTKMQDSIYIVAVDSIFSLRQTEMNDLVR